MKTKKRPATLARELVKVPTTRRNRNEVFQRAMIPASLTFWSINGLANNRTLAICRT